jgi:ribonuclease BN (tRNA processing enzyme)
VSSVESGPVVPSGDLLRGNLGHTSCRPAAVDHRSNGKTQVVLLGTGNPFPDPDRSGPATAIVVNGSAYLVDFGPGVVRRAEAAMFDKGIKALEPANLTVAFLTHLHSDHTVGYRDLIFTPWVTGRKVPLEVYGPKGIKAMTDHILAAWQADIEERISTESWQPGNYRDTYNLNVHEINPGVIYKDANVTVTAFPTKHAFRESYGYRFDTADRSIVISGDTTPAQSTIDACHGCDVLMHEVNTLEWLARRPDFQPYAAKYHTTTTQLAEIAKQGQASLADPLSCLNRSPSGFASRSIIAGPAFEGGALRVFRGSGCGPGPRRLLTTFGSIAASPGRERKCSFQANKRQLFHKAIRGQLPA